CIGRSHGIHAEPTTFGWKLVVWADELARARARLERAREGIAVGKLSGAVGTFAHLSPAIEEKAMAALGLKAAPASPQIIQRDRSRRHGHAGFHAASLRRPDGGAARLPRAHAREPRAHPRPHLLAAGPARPGRQRHGAAGRVRGRATERDEGLGRGPGLPLAA